MRINVPSETFCCIQLHYRLSQIRTRTCYQLTNTPHAGTRTFHSKRSNTYISIVLPSLTKKSPISAHTRRHMRARGRSRTNVKPIYFELQRDVRHRAGR
jgi:hypothetical protein